MKTATTYQRVIPRDLYNESKLLKCIGRLVLLIHDGKEVNGMTFKHDGEPFEIDQLEDDGALYITNLRFILKGKQLLFKSAYNSKANYPLYLYFDYCEYLVFDEAGEYTDEFIDFCNSF